MILPTTRKPPPGFWSIPGGFLRKGESLEEAALRVMSEKTGVNEVYLEQLYTFGDRLRTGEKGPGRVNFKLPGKRTGNHCGRL